MEDLRVFRILILWLLVYFMEIFDLFGGEIEMWDEKIECVINKNNVDCIVYVFGDSVF